MISYSNQMSRQFKIRLWYFATFFLLLMMVKAEICWSEPPRNPRVIFVELEFYPHKSEFGEGSDKILKKRFEDKIKDELKRLESARIIEAFEFLGSTTAKRYLPLSNWCKRLRYRYLIDGKITGMSEDTLNVTVTLSDFEKEDPEKNGYTKDIFIMKDLEVLEYWFDKISRNIRLTVEGKTPRDVIYTYCFYPDEPTLDEELKQKYTTRIIELGFPMQLRERLGVKLGKRYQIETFSSNELMAKKCREQKIEEEYDPDLQMLDYLLRGYVERGGDTDDDYIVNVEIYETVKLDKPKRLVEGFRQKYSATFFEDLAERIRTEWQNFSENR